MNEILQQFNLWAAVDVSIMAILIYQLLKLLKGTKAAQILIGILLVVGLFVFSSIFPLTTVHWMMNKFYSSFIIILIIIFQDDIRHVLSSMGRRGIFSGVDATTGQHVIDEITRAATSLAAKRIGALIVIERGIVLSHYIDIGVSLDARASKELLTSIFHPSSPLHDGAVIVRGSRLAAASCFLPLTKSESIDPNVGTRHRAAIGISEETDALVVVVSEEGASISIVENGVLRKKLDGASLREELSARLMTDDQATSTKPKGLFTDVFNYLVRKLNQSFFGANTKGKDDR